MSSLEALHPAWVHARHREYHGEITFTTAFTGSHLRTRRSELNTTPADQFDPPFSGKLKQKNPHLSEVERFIEAPTLQECVTPGDHHLITEQSRNPLGQMGRNRKRAPLMGFSRFRVGNQPAGLAIRPHQTTRSQRRRLNHPPRHPATLTQIGGDAVSHGEKQRRVPPHPTCHGGHLRSSEWPLPALRSVHTVDPRSMAMVVVCPCCLHPPPPTSQVGGLRPAPLRRVPRSQAPHSGVGIDDRETLHRTA